MPIDMSPGNLLSITHRADLDILVGRWGYQPNVTELPAAYDYLMQKALDCGCRFWLQDIRSRTLNDPQTTKWLLEEFFPQLAKQLAGRLTIAYLTSPTLMDLIVNSTGYMLPSAYSSLPFVVAFFGTEGESLAWLEQQRVVAAK